ncbi:TPA: DUF554 domain-containing protein [Candidatus Latescibacteria bacterium]|nr:DUF554 domain-containing protein [Candidatus Latescibacterota bacterium]
MIGTAINLGTVLAGSGTGLLIGHRIPDRVHETVLKGLGLLTLVIGLKMAFDTQRVTVMMGATLMGVLVGEGLRIQDRLDRLGDRLQRRFQSRGGRFSEAFMTSSLVFCVGPMTILGSIQDGLTGDYQLLLMKSFLDLFSSMAFAATLGVGVVCSAATVLLFQGGLTLAAGTIESVMTDVIVAEMTACGGLTMLGIGLVLLDVARIRVANFLPSLAIAPLIVWVLRTYGV